MEEIRKFETGATRDTDKDKLDYEGFTSPLVLEKLDTYMLRERDIAWAAGLFEGEGCIGLFKSNKKKDGSFSKQLKLEIKQTDEDVLQRFLLIIGYGKIRGPYWAKKSTKPFWSWQVSKIHEVCAVTCLLLPYMGARRKAKFLEVLGDVNITKKTGIPITVLESYALYLNKHRIQSDGSLRASDNWKKGIPTTVYAKSLFRHLMAVIKIHQGFPASDNYGPVTLEDSLCGVIFNAMGYLHEILKAESEGKDETSLCSG